MSDETRFWLKVSKSPCGCWNWTAAKINSGYGVFQRSRTGLTGPRQITAHRFAYEATKGPIPDGAFVLHSCDNKLCVNPAHLSLGDHGQNVAEAKARNRYISTNARLSPDQVTAIRASRERGIDAAKRYGVTPSAISNIRSFKRWPETVGAV